MDQHNRFDALRLPACIRRRGERDKFEPLRFRLLTWPCRRFGTFGEAARHGVRSAIRKTVQRELMHKLRDSLVSLHSGASPGPTVPENH